MFLSNQIYQSFVYTVFVLFSPLFLLGQVPTADEYENATPKEKVKYNLEKSKYYSTIHLDSSLYFSHGAMELSKEIDYPLGIGMSLTSIGKLEIQCDSLAIARQYLHEAINYLDDCNCDSLKAEVYFSIARIYSLHDNYSDAQEYFINSLRIAEKKELKSILYKLFFWMALMYDSMDNIQDAEHYFIKSVELSDTLKHDRNTILSLYELGMFYKNKGSSEAAIQNFQKAIVMSDEIGAPEILPLLYNEMGNVNYSEDNCNKALRYYDLAEKSIKKINPTNLFQINYWTAFTKYYQGRCYYHNSNYKTAINLLKNVKDTARGKNLIKLEADASEYLAKCYERLGNNTAAIGYFKDFHYLHDSIINAYNIAKVTKLEMEYQHTKELHEKRLKQLESEHKYQRKILLYNISGFAGFLIFIILALIFIIYRNRERARARHEKLEQEKLKAEKAHLERELSFKNRELTTSVMYLLKKNNYMLSLNEKLKNAILPLNPELKKPISDLIKETANHIESDTWKEFETRFNEVHQHFAEKLLTDFPNLTPNELKICAFLKLNMSTKEILTITHQSANSISVARHRLRTKLGIDRDENLVTFLSKY